MQLKSDETWIWHRYALTQLALGKTDAYRETCARLLERFGSASDLSMCHAVALTCLLAAGVDGGRGRPLALAAKAGTVRTNSAHQLTFGMALYRAGRFEEAVQRLDASLVLHQGSGFVTAKFLLAMAHHRLGHAAEARRWLDEALQALAAAEKATSAAGRSALLWYQRLQWRLVRREAEELLPSKKP